MQIRVLGCSGGIGEGLDTTCLLVDEKILIDAGTGIGGLPLSSLRKIRHVFVTHSHLDHIAGIPLLVDTIFDALDEPLTVHGRAETIAALRDHVFNNVIWPDFSAIPDRERPALRFQVMEAGEVRHVGDCTVELIPVNHAVPGAGYRVQCDGGAFAFSGDTTTNDTFWAALNRHASLDLLIVEAAFPDRDLELCRLAHHYCPSLLAEDLAKLRHRPQVYITHLKPGDEEEIVDQCRTGIRDLDVRPLSSGAVFRF